MKKPTDFGMQACLTNNDWTKSEKKTCIKSNAQFIVTEDHHYDILKTIDFPKVNIINLDEMMDRM